MDEADNVRGIGLRYYLCIEVERRSVDRGSEGVGEIIDHYNAIPIT